jgi:hypothetical protein
MPKAYSCFVLTGRRQNKPRWPSESQQRTIWRAPARPSGALAGGGEIVASVGTIEADVEYSTPRAAELKGISIPVEVVSVDWR